ncbi:MAG: hypothetical protein JJT95_02000 [Pararhodobacter sp.]|nr:hypothetical protein [Pararhodobacter sp.]
MLPVMAVFLKILGVLAGAYLLLVLLMAAGQTVLLFPRWAMAPGPDLPESAERLELALEGGEVLHGQLLPAPGGAGGERPLVLGFGGNAWDAVSVALYLRDVLPGHDVASFHYRGYAPSTGWPAASALKDDALAVHDHLQAMAGPRPVLAVGFSIGAGPAARLAAERELAGVVLVTPFESLHEVARQHYPWLPVGWLFRHRMEPAEDLADAGVPVALIVAAHDRIIPPARAAALAALLADAVPGVVFSREVEAGHNDLYGLQTFRETLRDAVVRIEEAAGEVP